MISPAASVAAILLFAGTALAGEKGMMHCFAFTTIDAATDAEWQAFYKGTDALPSKMPGIVKRVWYGKLRAPLQQFNVDAETRKKFTAANADAEGKVTRLMRQQGVCMEMANEAALKTYTDHPYHKEWVAIYEKVRRPGTTTFDIIGQ